MVSRSPISPQAGQSHFYSRNKIWFVFLLVFIMMAIAFLHITTTTYIMTRVPWGTRIDGIDIGGIPVETITSQLPTESVEFQMVATSINRTHTLNSDKLKITRHYDRVWDTIVATLDTPLNAWRWWILSIKNPTTFQSPLVADELELTQVVSTLAKQEFIEGRPPSVELKQSGDVKSLVVDPGENGFQVDEIKTKELIRFALSQRQPQIAVPLQSTTIALNSDQAEAMLNRAERLVGESLSFTLPDQPVTYKLSDVQLIELLNPDINSSVTSNLDFDLDLDQNSELPTTDSSNSGKLSDPVAVNKDLIEQITQDWSQKVDRPPQDPVLDISPDSLKVTKFVPPLDGLVVNQAQLQQLIDLYLNQVIHQAEVLELAQVANDQAMLDKIESDPDQIESTLPLPLSVQPPSTSLADTNNLGINEKIGHGQSRYAGSITTRIHNVSLATNRVNLIVLKPGQEFRFNDQLGDVSSATGYKPAYIIRSGRTVLGDGGGVCQVSTTMFRAALDAGLQITKRLPHSYRVSYYELDTKPGIDATVFAGEVDLRFVNDTPGHILIYGQADPKTLTMYYDFYGTSDGRVATISDHVNWAASSPLPPEYIYDPSLAPGQRKQIDWSAPGLKAKFTYTVLDRFGKELHKQTFTSNYRPWSAKYLVGTPPE